MNKGDNKLKFKIKSYWMCVSVFIPNNYLQEAVSFLFNKMNQD